MPGASRRAPDLPHGKSGRAMGSPMNALALEAFSKFVHTEAQPLKATAMSGSRKLRNAIDLKFAMSALEPLHRPTRAARLEQ